ncbi:MAG TPA: DNA polymerase IV [Candidatus Acidoferrum sp.]|nr:DNA polymerase IV [Candidatus Acidoferrum sp.]
MPELARFRAKHGPVEERPASAVASILHVDMDAFFVSVELLERPELRGKAVVVGGRPDQRGVVTAASYEARQFGVHSAMPLRTAGKLCPHAVFLEGHHEKYVEWSDRVAGILASFAPVVEMVSIDEAYLDLAGTERLYGPALAAADKLLRTITATTELPCSGGLATTRLAAKVASDQAKPRGLVWVAPGQEARFLAPLPVRKIPGIGEVTERALHGLGIGTVEQLAATPLERLENSFGQWGEALYRKARGGDSYEFVMDADAKSISHNHTFREDTSDTEVLNAMLSHLSQKACKRLREAGLAARTLTLTIRYAGFDTYTRAKTLGNATDLDANVSAVFQKLFREHRNPRRKIRLLGVSLSGLARGRGQLDLIEADRRARLEKLTKATDGLRDRFGFGKVQFGGSLCTSAAGRRARRREVGRFGKSQPQRIQRVLIPPRSFSRRIPYTSAMSPAAPPSGTAAQIRGGRFSSFWQRISEGRQIAELWSQFSADARASYGFYMKEADAEEMVNRRGRPRYWRILKTLFWSLVAKLTPARRVILVIGCVLLAVSNTKFEINKNVYFDFDFNLVSALLFLLLLALELADKVTMKRDLEIAREIQMWLVPSAAPEVPNAEVAFASRPQNSVAGDYYDAFYPTKGAADGGKLMLVIADVAGKSIPAALLMATLQASLRTIAGEGAPLADLIVRLNHYACAHSLDGRRFTTAVLGEYDPAERGLTYVNAGHNPPILRRASGDTEKLDVGGLPLGISADRTYATASLELKTGDTLILYTDGVIEAFDAEGEEFGEPRWLEAIRSLPDGSAQDSLHFLMRRVDEFVGVTRQSDDITCLVFRSR